jgi:hypothetical protein
MTLREERRLLVNRRQFLAKMLAHASSFKECDQCRSIAPQRLAICSFCGTYRFNEDPQAVQATLKEMAQRPLPVGAGVVPRV